MLQQLCERAFAAAGLAYRAETVVESFADLYAVVASGGGLALVPRAPREPAAGLHYVKLEPVGPRWTFVAATAAGRAVTPAARALLDLVAPQTG
jgi:DNA-binding transcriptional LysR family regulator